MSDTHTHTHTHTHWTKSCATLCAPCFVNELCTCAVRFCIVLYCLPCVCVCVCVHRCEGMAYQATVITSHSRTHRVWVGGCVCNGHCRARDWTEHMCAMSTHTQRQHRKVWCRSIHTHTHVHTHTHTHTHVHTHTRTHTHTHTQRQHRKVKPAS